MLRIAEFSVAKLKYRFNNTTKCKTNTLFIYVS